MSKIGKFFEKLIPSYIPNTVVLMFFTGISIITGPVKKRIRDVHYEENQELLAGECRHLLEGKDLIENQSDWGKVLFGSHKKSNISYSGCGIIATYNALKVLGDKGTPMTYLIKYYEQTGITLKGGFGITPRAPYQFFKKKGYDVAKITTRRTDIINEFGNRYTAFIVTFYWDKSNINSQLHTVCISKEADGFYIHNIYCKKADGSYTRQGSYASLTDAVNGTGKNTVPLVIIGIRQKKVGTGYR